MMENEERMNHLHTRMVAMEIRLREVEAEQDAAQERLNKAVARRDLLVEYVECASKLKGDIDELIIQKRQKELVEVVSKIRRVQNEVNVAANAVVMVENSIHNIGRLRTIEQQLCSIAPELQSADE